MLIACSCPILLSDLWRRLGSRGAQRIELGGDGGRDWWTECWRCVQIDSGWFFGWTVQRNSKNLIAPSFDEAKKMPREASSFPGSHSPASPRVPSVPRNASARSACSWWVPKTRRKWLRAMASMWAAWRQLDMRWSWWCGLELLELIWQVKSEARHASASYFGIPIFDQRLDRNRKMTYYDISNEDTLIHTFLYPIPIPPRPQAPSSWGHQQSDREGLARDLSVAGDTLHAAAGGCALDRQGIAGHILGEINGKVQWLGSKYYSVLETIMGFHGIVNIIMTDISWLPINLTFTEIKGKSWNRKPWIFPWNLTGFFPVNFPI